VQQVSLIGGERLEKPAFAGEQQRERAPAEPVAGSREGDRIGSSVVLVASPLDQTLALEPGAELFAAFSLKQTLGEGLTPEQLVTVDGPDRDCVGARRRPSRRRQAGRVVSRARRPV
jgi:hypothetical protein